MTTKFGHWLILLKGLNPLGINVYKRKTDMEGNVITYKVRLVAKGYKQR